MMCNILSVLERPKRGAREGKKEEKGRKMEKIPKNYKYKQII